MSAMSRLTPAIDIRRSSLQRHILVLLVAGALVALFAIIHAQWSPMHRWNRTFGDVSLVLVSMSVAIGPLSRLWRPSARLIPLRRELGIHSCVFAFVHAAIILVGWVQWDLMRLFGFEWHPGLGEYVMFQQGFALGNAIGLAALFLVLILAITSSDFAIRKLGASGWKFLQMGVQGLWWLTVAHVAYFLFAHFLSFHRAIPDPNPLQWPFVGLVGVVFALRVAAYVVTVRTHKRGSGRASRAEPVSA